MLSGPRPVSTISVFSHALQFFSFFLSFPVGAIFLCSTALLQSAGISQCDFTSSARGFAAAPRGHLCLLTLVASGAYAPGPRRPVTNGPNIKQTAIPLIGALLYIWLSVE